MNIVVTERDKKLLRLVACLAIIVIFGMYLIRPAMKNHETLQNEYDAAEQKQQEYQTQIATLATIDDIIAQNEAALNTASEKYYKGDLETRQMDDIITGYRARERTVSAVADADGGRSGCGQRVSRRAGSCTDGQQCGHLVRCGIRRFDRRYIGSAGAAGQLRLHRHCDYLGAGRRNPVAELSR